LTTFRERVESARVATLATIDADGAPNLVPVTFVLDGETVYSAVDHKPKTTQRLKRLANIRRDSRVTLLVHSYDDDWSQLWWCRLRGKAEVLDDGADDARRLLAEKYDQYRERLPSGPVIAVAIEEWTGWSATET
jgi:PPOX class probable F420-dependent enzyme